jgi:hypothetical protein
VAEQQPAQGPQQEGRGEGGERGQQGGRRVGAAGEEHDRQHGGQVAVDPEVVVLDDRPDQPGAHHLAVDRLRHRLRLHPVSLPLDVRTTLNRELKTVNSWRMVDRCDPSG